MQERMYKGLVIRQRAVEDLPWWVQEDTDFLNLACYECACYVLTFFVCVFGIYIYIWNPPEMRMKETPLPENTRCHVFVDETMEGKPWHPPLVWPPRGKVELTSSGDCAAFHAGWAIGSPVARCGICARCCAPKNEWINEDAIKKARKRSFVTQCVANHINPFKFLPGFEDKDPPKCFHCGKTVDDALEAAEHAEMENASPSGRLQLTADHIKSHAGGLRGWRPNFPMDNRRRSRGLLHRRMNVVSNCIAGTILRVTFNPAHGHCRARSAMAVTQRHHCRQRQRCQPELISRARAWGWCSRGASRYRACDKAMFLSQDVAVSSVILVPVA